MPKRHEHPSEELAARIACGESTWVEKIRWSAHVKRCAICEEQALRYEFDRSLIAETVPKLPVDFEWDGLEREMRANILVGLSASRAIRPEPAERLNWRVAFAASALCVLVISGWLMQDPRQLVQKMQAAWRGESMVPMRILERADGIGMEVGERQMMLLEPERVAATVSFRESTPRQMSSSYVDAESGQVTINHVSME